MHDVDNLFADSIDQDIWRATHHPFAGTSAKSWTAQVGLFLQQFSRFDNPLGHLSGRFHILLKIVDLACF